MGYIYDFKVGSRVRVATEPPNSTWPIFNKMGVIEEINGDYCSIRLFSIAQSGGHSGCATVPLGCLEPVASPTLEQKITDYEQWRHRILAEAEARRSRWSKLVTETAARFNLDLNVVEEIMDIGRSWM